MSCKIVADVIDDGIISGRVTGHQIHSEEARFVEIPCWLKFVGSSKNVRKLKKVLQDLDSPCVKILARGFPFS